MSDYVEVSATVTHPSGDVLADRQHVGSVPSWAWDDPSFRAGWKRTYRKVALDSVGTYGGAGWRVTFSAERVS
jgi:hypothetical protein